MRAGRSEIHFWLRSLRYERLHADARIADRTAFFAAAAVVTRAFAYAPATRFICNLSSYLEGVNLQRAMQIRQGLLYEEGTVIENTVDFIRTEQRLVQRGLEDLRTQDPSAYRLEIDGANNGLQRLHAGCAPLQPLAHWRLSQAISRARAELLHVPDFSLEEDRQILGIALAAETTGLRLIR